MPGGRPRSIDVDDQPTQPVRRVRVEGAALQPGTRYLAGPGAFAALALAPRDLVCGVERGDAGRVDRNVARSAEVRPWQPNVCGALLELMVDDRHRHGGGA